MNDARKKAFKKSLKTIVLGVLFLVILAINGTFMLEAGGALSTIFLIVFCAGLVAIGFFQFSGPYWLKQVFVKLKKLLKK